MDLIFDLIKKNRNLILYGGIGVSAVLVDFGLFFILVQYFDIFPTFATVMSVFISMVYAFTLNAHYNFKTRDNIKKRLLSYSIVSGIGMLVSASVIDLLVRFQIDPNLAKAISLPPIVFMQYLLNVKVTFRQAEELVEKSVSLLDNKKREGKIAIVGGGFTGLTSAYELSKKGYDVTVFEATDSLGGLVSGFDIDGLPLERAYHFLYKTDSSIIGLANEIGVGDKLHFHKSSLSLFYEGKLYPFMTPKDLLSFTPLSFFNRIRAGVIALYLSKQTRWKGFAKISAMDWMNKWGGKKVTKVIWEPILRGKFFNFYDKIAMSYVWSRVFVRANSKDRGDVTEKLGYFDGGFQTFSNALVKKARENGVQFVMNSKLDSINHADGQVFIKNNGQESVFDACLATTPSHVFSKLISNNKEATQDYIKSVNSIDYIGAVLMVFSTDKKLTDYYWHNINDPEIPFLVMLSLSALVGTEKLNGKNIYYIGAYVPHDHKYFSMSDKEISDLWFSGVKKIFPDFKPSMVLSNNIFKFKNAQHIVDVDYEKKIPAYESPVPGVYLSNFSQIFPDDRGTNYAVAEGQKVSSMID